MALLAEEEIAALEIERMIFHVVKPDMADPLFLAEVSPPAQTPFFLERVKETLKGAAYLFAPGSGIPALLKRTVPAGDGKDEFVSVSRQLAERFKVKVKQDKRFAPGVLMLFLLKAGGERYVAIIKYEHRQVISYSYQKNAQGKPLVDKDGNPVPDLQSLVQTFTEDRKAMQKSAVIRFGSVIAGDDGEENRAPDQLVVIDHSSGRYRDASQHFANFLDIRRAMAPSEMTKRLEDAAVAAIKAHKDDVPPAVAKAPKRFVREAMARMDGFDHEKPEEFMGAIVQGLQPDAAVLDTFSKNLSKYGLATEAFPFDGAVPPEPENRRVVTEEGMALFFKRVHEENKKVTIVEDDEGGVTITVKATGLVWNDEIDKLPRLSD